MGMGTVLTPHLFRVLLLTLWHWLGALFGWRRAPAGLHTARFATKQEIASLTTKTLPAARLLPASSLLLGTDRQHQLVGVHPTPTRREIGNLLVVGPTRSGKGLLAISQLLTWSHSVIVNDIKGELFAATAGYRSKLGPVFVLDPTGVGNGHDPLSTRQTDEELLSAATSLLMTPDEGEGFVFTQRAIVMLRQLFLAARKENIAPFPYVRHMIYLSLPQAAARVQSIEPRLATRFLDSPYNQAALQNKFLLSAWSVLAARMEFVVTENLVRTLSGSDFSAADLLLAPKPVTVYLRWKERDLLALAPAIRLLWDSLIGDVITTYDERHGVGCRPVLLLLDEVGRTAIPNLSEHATTVVGRGISLWIAIQSLSQLETVYGKAPAETLRNNMDSQIYYRPIDLNTATYLEKRLGSVSAYAESITFRGSEEIGWGRAERPIPLFSAQEILQMPDEDIISIHRNLPPMYLTRMDWRTHQLLAKRQAIPPPPLAPLPSYTIPETRTELGTDAGEYIDAD